MRFREQQPKKQIYKPGQVPRRMRREDELQITDMRNKHRLPLPLEQFKEMQSRYYEDKQGGTASQLVGN